MRENPGLACRDVESRFSPQIAMEAQRLLTSKLVLEDRYGPIRYVAGLDVAYVKRGEETVGAGVAVLLSYPSLEVEDCVAYVARVCIPYIPGLLAFREMNVLAPAVLKLESKNKVDLYVVDGHGIAHPRRFGIASHVGVVMDKPSIGVAKKRLYGREEVWKGSRVLLDEDGRILALILKSGRGSKIYVSPGHRITPFSAARLVSSMLRRGHRLPEPTRVADRISKSIRTRLKAGDMGSGFIDCLSNRSLYRFF